LAGEQVEASLVLVGELRLARLAHAHLAEAHDAVSAEGRRVALGRFAEHVQLVLAGKEVRLAVEYRRILGGSRYELAGFVEADDAVAAQRGLAGDRTRCVAGCVQGQSDAEQA